MIAVFSCTEPLRSFTACMQSHLVLFGGCAWFYLGGFILPSLLMPYLYGHILYVACTSYKKIKRTLDQSSKSSSPRMQIKLSAMVLLVYLSFLVTFFPYFGLFIIDLLGGQSNYWHYQIVAYFINFQGMCNFIIYGAVNPEFRSAYRRSLHCKALSLCNKRRTSLTVSPLVN